MTTTIKGWCAWHKDYGFWHETFADNATNEQGWLMLHNKIAPFDSWQDVGFEVMKKNLEHLGWRVRPCKMTFEATDMSVTEMREKHGISADDRKGSKEEVEILSGKRIYEEEK